MICVLLAFNGLTGKYLSIVVLSEMPATGYIAWRSKALYGRMIEIGSAEVTLAATLNTT